MQALNHTRFHKQLTQQSPLLRHLALSPFVNSSMRMLATLTPAVKVLQFCSVLQLCHPTPGTLLTPSLS